jgi:hypothetical protein
MKFESTPLPADWRAHLFSLPQVDAPDAVWERVLVSRMRRRRLRLAGWSAAACMVVAVAGALLAGSWPVERRGGVADATVAVDPVGGEVQVTASLREIDDALARAYSMEGDEAELRALWDARSRVLESTTSGREPLLVQL